MNLLQATSDPMLFARWFKDRATWDAWLAFIAALFGLPMTPEQLAIYQRCTGRAEPPTEASAEGVLVVGRRGGKSFVLALIGVFLAAFRDYRPYLQPGERATILIIAADRRQARVIFRYVRALLTLVPMLARLVERQTADAFDLTSSVSIEVGTASFRTTRGYAIAAALLDEAAFWRTDDAAEPDHEILAAIRPGMVQFPNAVLLIGSSPYARRGVLWEAFKRWFGKPGGPLVWQADTRTMNPTVPQRVIDEATERDPASAAAEYGAQFRSDIESFVSREAVAAVVPSGVRERGALDAAQYVAFVDPSGGSVDSMTLAIAHQDGLRGVLDCLRERRAPFSPESVVEEFATTLEIYGITEVTGDRYAGEWPREAFRRHGITYVPAEKPKSDLYRDLLPLVNSGEVALLDNDRLFNQLVSLERRTARGGRDSIDHPPGAHDDLANAAAGALVLAAEPGLSAEPCFGMQSMTGGDYNDNPLVGRSSMGAGEPDFPEVGENRGWDWVQGVLIERNGRQC